MFPETVLFEGARRFVPMSASQLSGLGIAKSDLSPATVWGPHGAVMLNLDTDGALYRARKAEVFGAAPFFMPRGEVYVGPYARPYGAKS